jgi:hypothetical protein
MNKILALALALAGAASVSACQTPQQQTGTLAGGAIGAGTGALIGNAVTQPTGRCAQWGWDANGNRVCTAFY